MKKVFMWTAFILLIFILASYAVLSFRQKKSYEQLIPNNTASVIRINADGVLKSILWNAITNPAYYIKISKDKKEKSAQSLHTGLDMPGNLFFYSVKTKPTFTYFTSLSICDSLAFKRFIQQILAISHYQVYKQDSNIHWAISKNGKVNLAFLKDKVAISFSNTSESTLDVLINILHQKNTLKIKESQFFSRINDKEGHLIYASDSADLMANFNEGNLDLQGTIRSSLVVGKEKLRPKKFANNSLVKLWLDADITPLIKRNRHLLDRHHIPADTLLSYYGSYLDFEWKNHQIIQKDTIITYDYNDDFERVEKRSVKEERVPEIYLALEASPHLANYIPKQVYYKFQSGTTANRLYFGTGTSFKDDREPSLSTNFFYLFVDVEKLFNQEQFLPQLKEYATEMKSLHVKASAKKDFLMSLEGKLYFREPSISSLLQWYLTP